MKTRPALTTITRSRYDRLAPRYDLMMGLMERLGMARLRRLLWSRVEGRVLEVGVGTGANLPFYPNGSRIVAIDLSPRMLDRAREKARKGRLPVGLGLMDAQALGFKDGSFDVAVGSWVFCSVPDPLVGLRELKRALRPGGRLLLLEHVRLPGLPGRLMDLLNPLAVRLGGENINRNTVENVRRAGFQIEEARPFLWGLVRLIQARGLPGGSPAIPPPRG